jgi:hypothetical protein
MYPQPGTRPTAKLSFRTYFRHAHFVGEDTERSTMLLIVLERQHPPCASTVIFCDRSPLATAVVTSDVSHLRRQFDASPFTLSVRSHTPVRRVPSPSAQLPSVPPSRDTRHLAGKAFS